MRFSDSISCRNRDGPRRAALIVFALFLATCVTLPALLPGDTPSAVLKVHGNDGSVTEYRAYPEATAKMLFPSTEAWLEAEGNAKSWDFSSSPILKRIHLLRVSDRGRRFTVTGASVGGQLFIFDSLFCRENSAAMTELIRAARCAPRDDWEALDLVKLYLALSYYALEDPARFVALRGVSHIPKVSQQSGVYSVKLVTYGKPGLAGGDTDWEMTLATSKFAELMARPEPSLAKLRENQGNKEIKFTLTSLGDGRADDGAKTGLQSWAASDGPGIFITHFYYPSFEKGERRMQDFFQHAVAMLENGPWRNAAGEVSGKRALVVLADKDAKSLFASQLYQEGSTVTEISCSCLSNLLAARSKGHSGTHH